MDFLSADLKFVIRVWYSKSFNLLDFDFFLIVKNDSSIINLSLIKKNWIIDICHASVNINQLFFENTVKLSL